MAIFSDILQEEVRLEYMRPEQLVGLPGINPRTRATGEIRRENTERLITFLENWVKG